MTLRPVRAEPVKASTSTLARHSAAPVGPRGPERRPHAAGPRRRAPLRPAPRGAQPLSPVERRLLQLHRGRGAARPALRGVPARRPAGPDRRRSLGRRDPAQGVRAGGEPGGLRVPVLEPRAAGRRPRPGAARLVRQGPAGGHLPLGLGEGRDDVRAEERLVRRHVGRREAREGRRERRRGELQPQPRRRQRLLPLRERRLGGDRGPGLLHRPPRLAGPAGEPDRVPQLDAGGRPGAARLGRAREGRQRPVLRLVHEASGLDPVPRLVEPLRVRGRRRLEALRRAASSAGTATRSSSTARTSSCSTR